MDQAQARKALLGINLVLGVMFVLFPRLSMRVYGLDPEDNASAAYPLRYLGARSLVLAALMADEEGNEALAKQVAVFAGADTTVNVLAAASGEVPRRATLLGALTSAIGVGLSLANRQS